MNRNRPRRHCTYRALVALLPLTACIVPSAQAADPIKVTTSVDAQHYAGGCTLRDAIQNVTNRNQTGSMACPAGTGDDIIIFDGVNAITLDPMLGEIHIGQDPKLQIRGGAGNVELSGGQATRIFHINGAGTRVYFSNIHFRDGNAMSEGRGGAVYVDGAKLVDFINVRFDNNIATNGGGALAIDGDGSMLNVLETTFYLNNSPGDANGDQGYGGALDMRGITDALIVNSDFGMNQARSGGAIHCETSAASTMLAISGGLNGKHKGSFDNNIAWAPNADRFGSEGGGAIDSGCPMRIMNMVFHRNFALGKGAAIYQKSGGHLAYIDNSTFESNAFMEASALEGNGLGGAIASEGAIEIERSSFADNTALRGGALHIRDTQVNKVRIVNSTIVKNSAWESGGALYLDGAVKASIWNVTMMGNTGTDSFHFETPAVSSAIDWKNTILDSGGANQNCGGDVHTVSGGPSNIQGADVQDNCPFALGLPFGDAAFGELSAAWYYPLTLVLPIAPGGDAASKGDTTICGALGRDQLGQPRNASRCSIGAVEP